MNRESLSSRPAAAPFAATLPVGVAAVVDLVDRLIEVIEAENDELARGLPAAASIDGRDKARLADELRDRLAAGFDRATIAAAPAELRSRMVERVRLLERRTRENSTRLEAAITATRRRVDAVMRAIRTEMARNGHAYGANGRLPATAPASAVGRGRLI